LANRRGQSGRELEKPKLYRNAEPVRSAVERYATRVRVRPMKLGSVFFISFLVLLEARVKTQKKWSSKKTWSKKHKKKKAEKKKKTKAKKRKETKKKGRQKKRKKGKKEKRKKERKKERNACVFQSQAETNYSTAVSDLCRLPYSPA
jgi:hypothetical protein